MLYATRCAEDGPAAVPSTAQFFQSVNDQMRSLQLLSLLLTGDSTTAEQCFIAAIEDYGEQDGTFVEWGRSRARRAVCTRAIQMMRPALEPTDGLRNPGLEGTAEVSKKSPFGWILSLSEFERFVYVITVLEGQRDRDCAGLLGCTDRDVLIARALAVTRLAQNDHDLDWAVESLQF